jgi:hypothetical protein
MNRKSPKNTGKRNGAKSPTRKSPKSFKKKPIRNVYTLLQFKKHIGKKLIIPWKGMGVNIDREAISKIKTQIMNEPNKKTITITCVCMGGILYVINGIEKYMGVNTISYDEIKKKNLKDVPIVIIQYMDLSQSEIKKMI